MLKTEMIDITFLACFAIFFPIPSQNIYVDHTRLQFLDKSEKRVKGAQFGSTFVMFDELLGAKINSYLCQQCDNNVS